MNATKQPAQSREEVIVQRASWGTQLMAGIMLLVEFYILYVLTSTGEKTLLVYIAAVIILCTMLIAGAGLVFAFRQRQELGVQLVFLSMFVEEITVGMVAQGRAPSTTISHLAATVIGYFLLFRIRLS